jgi:hypothetical protein
MIPVTETALSPPAAQLYKETWLALRAKKPPFFHDVSGLTGVWAKETTVVVDKRHKSQKNLGMQLFLK